MGLSTFYLGEHCRGNISEETWWREHMGVEAKCHANSKYSSRSTLDTKSCILRLLVDQI